MTERRYSEEEVANIFERAAEAQRTGRRRLAPGDGMTLPELQEIGREVGLTPELVAQAARSLDRPERSTSRTWLGLPIGVGRTVELDRRLSDEEWEQLVVDLRQTFQARGVVRYNGPFREWTNGNLQALLEPTSTGHRLRLQTVKGDARNFMAGGVAILAVAAATILVSALAGKLADPGSLNGVLLMSVLGVGMFGIGALRVPAWARRRRRQMEDVAARLELAAKPRDPEDAGRAE